MAGTSHVGVLLIAFVTLVVGKSLVAGIPLVEVVLLLNGWSCSPICLRKRMKLILMLRFD